MDYKILISRWKTRRVGFRFDMYAWHKLCEMNGIEIHQLGDLPQEKMMSDLVYGAYVSDCKEKGKRVRYSQDQLGEIIDHMTKQQTEQLALQILESKVFGKPVKEWSEKKKKK